MEHIVTCVNQLLCFLVYVVLLILHLIHTHVHVDTHLYQHTRHIKPLDSHIYTMLILTMLQSYCQVLHQKFVYVIVLVELTLTWHAWTGLDETSLHTCIYTPGPRTQ